MTDMKDIWKSMGEYYQIYWLMFYEIWIKPWEKKKDE